MDIEQGKSHQERRPLAKEGGGYALQPTRPDQPLPNMRDFDGEGAEGEELVAAVGAELARRATDPTPDDHRPPNPAAPPPEGLLDRPRALARRLERTARSLRLRRS